MKQVAGGQRETGDRMTGEGERSIGLRFSCDSYSSVPPKADKWRLGCRQQMTMGIPHQAATAASRAKPFSHH